MSLIILYKNTQTEGEKVYKDLWQLSPYEPQALFDSGFTSEQAEYIIPDGLTIIKHEGKLQLKKADYLYEIFTNHVGNPGIRFVNGSIIKNELYKPGEEPKPEPKPEQISSVWVPKMVNGEWEIY